MPLSNRTTLEINLSSLQHNYNALRAQTAQETKFMAVVKANAYGSESCSIANKLEELGVDYFAVAYALEGEFLRQSGIKTPILVLHPQSGQLEELLKLNLEPTIYAFKGLEEAIKQASISNVPVHIKINTGLNRLGFKPSEIPRLLQLLNANPHLKITSVYSHLIASEDADSRMLCQNQINQFNQVLNQFTVAGIQIPLRHMCNTSGILNFKEAHFDMVRAGIGLYGFSNGSHQVDLKPIGKLSTVISKINQIEAGELVGYNSGFIATKSTRVATIPIGHADGIGRIYSKGKGVVWINNQPATVLGNVCMDMMMVDVTSVECEEGDQVILFDEQYSASEFAERAGTISYELITAIGPRVSRLIKE